MTFIIFQPFRRIRKVIHLAVLFILYSAKKLLICATLELRN